MTEHSCHALCCSGRGSYSDNVFLQASAPLHLASIGCSLTSWLGLCPAAVVVAGRTANAAAWQRLSLAMCDADGSWVLPQQVVAPDQPGRKVCMLGATSNLLSSLPWVSAADAVVLGADIQVHYCFGSGSDLSLIQQLVMMTIRTLTTLAVLFS